MLLPLWLNLELVEGQQPQEAPRRGGGGGKARGRKVAKPSRKVRRYFTVYDDEPARIAPPAPPPQTIIEPAPAPIEDSFVTNWLEQAATPAPVKQLPPAPPRNPEPRLSGRAEAASVAAALPPAEQLAIEPRVEDDEEDEIEMLLLHLAA